MIKVKTVEPCEREVAVGAVVQAFMADPAARWVYPDPERYLESFPDLVNAFAGVAFEHGSAERVDGSAAAALWLPPGVHADDEALAAVLSQSVPVHEQADVFALFEAMARFHPSQPHWYLPMIGVDPAQQGRGYGSALLSYALARCDVEGIPAYLESTSLQSRRLYERHGFELLGTIQIASAPPLFPMIRRPRRLQDRSQDSMQARR